MQTLNNPAVEAAVLLQQANTNKGTDVMDSIELRLNGKRSVEYAKARGAINQRTYELYKDNAAGAKNYKHPRKKIVIEHLGGKVQWMEVEDRKDDGVVLIEKKKFVVFPDGSKARY